MALNARTAMAAKYSTTELPSATRAVDTTDVEVRLLNDALGAEGVQRLLEVMGLPFRFEAGEGPVIEKPLRTRGDVARLRTDGASELGYVSEAIRLVTKHFGGRLPVIGFCGAPFTLASYMIEGGGSRSYIETKKMMYNLPPAWAELMGHTEAVDLLQETLDEEKAADEKLNHIAESSANAQAEQQE